MTTLRSLLVVACLLLIGCSTTSSAPSANMPPSVDVTGTWSGTYSWQYGVMPMTIILQQSGGEVEGEIRAAGRVVETRQGGGPVRGTVSDDAVVLTYASGSANLTVKEDRMTGVSSAGSYWNLLRQR